MLPTTRWWKYGILGLTLGYLSPGPAQAANFGDRRTVGGVKLTPEVAQKMLAEWRASGGDSLAAPAAGNPSLLALVPYANRAACDAAIPTKTDETFHSTLRLSSAWACTSPMSNSAGGGCYNVGDLKAGYTITNPPGTNNVFADKAIAWSPDDGIGSFTSSGRLNLDFTAVMNTVCLDVTHLSNTASSATITVEALNGATSLGTASCTPVNCGGSCDSCFIGFTAPSNITKLRWTSTGIFDGVWHMSFGTAAAATPTPTPGSCDLTPVQTAIAKLETKADKAEGKLDTIGNNVNTINTNVNSVNTKANALEVKADKAEGKLDTIGTNVNSVNTKANALEAKADKHEGKLDGINTAVGKIETKADKAEGKLDQLSVRVDDFTRKMIEDNLNEKKCTAWMYTPASLGGSLEVMLDQMQKVIDNAKLLGCIKDEDLDKAQCQLNQAKALAATAPPLDCRGVCGMLIEAYDKATAKDHKKGEDCKKGGG